MTEQKKRGKKRRGDQTGLLEREYGQDGVAQKLIMQ